MSKVASITRAGGLIVNPQHATASTTQYARGYISEGPAVTDGLVLYLDAADYASYPGEYSLLDVSGGIGWVDYSSSQQHYRTMGEKGVILLGTSTGWIGRFEVTPTVTGNHTLMFDYWADAQVTMVFNNDGIMDNAYTATLTAETYKKTHSVTVNHTTTGAMYHYFRNNASGTKVYIDNVRFFKNGTAWNDLSGKGNDGTISGATFAVDSTAGPYLDFDGSNDDINVGDIGDVFGTSFAIAMWIKTDDVSNRKEFIGQYVDSNNWWRWGNDELGNWEIDVQDSGSRTVSVNPDWSVVTNQWHHIVLSRSGSTWGFYKNGEEDGTGSDNSTIPDMAASVRIGNSTSSAYFNGKIAGVQIYEAELTAAQIKQNFNAERNRFGV